MKRSLTPWAARALAGTLAVLLAGIVIAAAGTAGAKGTAPKAASGTDRGGYLGVNLQDLSQELGESYDYKGTGAVVTRVVPGSPADEVGVQEGDIITRFNDLQVNSADQLTDRVRALSPGDLASVWVWRDGKEQFLGRAELASRGSSRWDDDRAYTPAPPAAPRAPRPPRPPRVYHYESPAPHAMPNLHNVMGRGRLGIEIRDLDKDLGEYFSVPDGHGVLVLHVLEDTPAEKGGLKAGDVIVSVAGKSVEDSDDLRRALRDREAGPVAIGIKRKGTARTVNVELEDRRTGVWINGADGEWKHFMGDGDWMTWMDGDHGDGRSVIRLRDLDGDGDIEIHGMNEWTPEERAKFKADMQKLKQDLQGMSKRWKIHGDDWNWNWDDDDDDDHDDAN